MSKLTLPCLKQKAKGKEKVRRQMGVGKGKERSAAVGCYHRSVHPSLSACGSGSAAAEGVEVDWLELALSLSQHRACGSKYIKKGKLPFFRTSFSEIVLFCFALSLCTPTHMSLSQYCVVEPRPWLLSSSDFFISCK